MVEEKFNFMKKLFLRQQVLLCPDMQEFSLTQMQEKQFLSKYFGLLLVLPLVWEVSGRHNSRRNLDIWEEFSKQNAKKIPLQTSQKVKSFHLIFT